MDNPQEDSNRPHGEDGDSYDWSISAQPGNSHAVNTATEELGRRSALVPILVGLICLLVVVVVVGVLILFLQRDKNEPMDEAAVAASESSSSGTSLTTVTAQAAENSKNNAASRVQNKATGKTPDTCAELKKSFERENGVKIKDKNDSLLPSDFYVNYCDGKWGQIVIAEWGIGDVEYWDGDRWIEISGRVIEDDYGPGIYCFDKKALMAYNPPQKALDGMRVQFCEDVIAKKSSQADSTSEGGSSSGGNSEVTGLSMPACDGRYVLIVDSVIVTAGEDAQSKVSQSLAQYPGASVTKPGACGSLRAVDPDSGGDIYPIYYDYGFDLDAACVGRQNNGNVGNVRKLSNQTEQVNLCP